MPGIWKPRTFPASDVEKAIEAIKGHDHELWEQFKRYQRLEEGFNHNEGYKALNTVLTKILHDEFSDLTAADLNKLLFQVRQKARLESGLSI